MNDVGLKVKIEIIEASETVFRYTICPPQDKDSWGCENFVKNLLRVAGGVEDKAPQETKQYYVWIVVHPIGDFLSGSRSKPSDEIPFSQSLLLSSNNSQFPILHIATTDIYASNLYNPDETLNSLVPRCFQIMDSSIWNYLVTPFDIDVYKKIYNENGVAEKVLDYTIEWTDTFRDAIHSIYRNYHEKKLYDLTIAHEYADLNARLTSESYLSGAHAKGVSPFIFHSEDVTRRMIQKEFSGCNNTIENIKQNVWRILLVDDRAITEMDKIDEPKENDAPPSYEKGIVKSTCDLPWNCKLNIIVQLLEKAFDISDISYRQYDGNQDGVRKDIDKHCRFLIEYAESLNDAVCALRTKKYDIILLDYLLIGKHNNYGYQLLDKIVDDYDSQRNCTEKVYRFKYGPRKRFFFMFISAYSSAVYERLLAEGLNQSEDYWFISVGACPTNTPQLFLYNLIKLMEKRLDDSGILKLSSDEIYSLVNKIYLPKEQDPRGDSVRKRANALYQKVLSLQYHYRNILKDVEIPFGQNSSIFDTKGSVLMTDFIQKKINLGGMLEHLTQLVHLTAFGTVRQWPEMWEEYIYFKAQFEKQQTEGSDAVESAKLDKLFSYIERYILELKSQQR